MELSCALAVNVLDQFVSVGIKQSASLPQLKRHTISENCVNWRAKTVTTQEHVAQQVNLDYNTDCQRKELVFVLAHPAIISKVKTFIFNYNFY